MPTFVDDYTALLHENDLRWNKGYDPGTSIIITYSFVETADLPSTATNNPFGATSYWEYNSAQKANFRKATEVFEAAMGVRFVEVDESAMINAYGASGSDWAGWATYPISWPGYAGTTGRVVMDRSDNFDLGSASFQIVLHELGHSFGLKHPFEGEIQLIDSLENTDHTLMSYTWRGQGDHLRHLDLDALDYLYGKPYNSAVQTSFDAATNTVRVIGTSRSDDFIGVSERNHIEGRGGNDLISGRQYDDALFGGSGRDTIDGWSGEDLIEGGSGNDTLDGGGGNDTLNAGTGTDTVDGGSGNDTLILEGLQARYQPILSSYLDGGSIRIRDGQTGEVDEIDRVESFRFDNKTVSLAGLFDLPDLKLTSSGNPGDITVGSPETTLVTVKNDGNAISAGFALGVYLSVDGALGPADDLIGTASFGALGAGQSQTMQVTLDPGQNQPGGTYSLFYKLDTGGKIAELDKYNNVVGKGAIEIVNDAVAPLPDPAPVIADQGRPSDKVESPLGTDAAPISVRGKDVQLGSAGKDRLKGSGEQDKLVGRSGNDRLDGKSGKDVLKGGDGKDRLKGGKGADQLDGDAGRDVLKGGAGRDKLDGGAGRDKLIGGAAKDILVGGAGADLFKFGRKDGPDVIRDFGRGKDKIDLKVFNTSFSDLKITEKGAKILIKVDKLKLTLAGFESEDLGANDFLF